MLDPAHPQDRRLRLLVPAIDGGADSIEHGNDATDAQLQTMRAKGIFFDMTLTVWDGMWSKIHEVVALSPATRSDLAGF